MSNYIDKFTYEDDLRNKTYATRIIDGYYIGKKEIEKVVKKVYNMCSSDLQRDFLILYLQEYSLEQIAKKLGKTYEAVRQIKSRLFRMLSKKSPDISI